jgi:hydrogenase expression/formation protein HypE
MSDPVFSCPLPHGISETIQLAHGGGGRAMKQLIDKVIRPAFDNDWLQQEHDGAVFEINGQSAMTTDSYVVSPLFFPGGDIGKIAVYGTINDLLMCGAIPRYMSVSLILEEGLPMSTLIQVVSSMAMAAAETAVKIVTGDIKVVDRGKADRMYINTTGIGEVITPNPITPASIRPGNAVIISGDIGRHGIAVMAVRKDLKLDTTISSDCAALTEPVLALIHAGINIRCLRDLTRGGLASALVEIAETAGLLIEIEEDKLSVRDDVQAVCELLGFDPLHVANEGRFVLFVENSDADETVAILRRFDICQQANHIGQVSADAPARVTMKGRLGTTRVIDMLSGNQLPRIC